MFKFMTYDLYSLHLILHIKETIICGSGPISKNDPPMRIESGFVSSLFTKYCGSSTERPTCTCADGSKWRHPYYIAECSDTSVTVQQGFRDTNIGQRIIGDLYSKNFTLSIGNSKYRYANKVQTTHSHIKTNSFIVLCCLHFSIIVHKFLLFRSHREAAEDSISFAYSCFIPESLLYCH